MIPAPGAFLPLYPRPLVTRRAGERLRPAVPWLRKQASLTTLLLAAKAGDILSFEIPPGRGRPQNRTASLQSTTLVGQHALGYRCRGAKMTRGLFDRALGPAFRTSSARFVLVVASAVASCPAVAADADCVADFRKTAEPVL